MQLVSINRAYLKSTLKRVTALAIMIIITVSSVVTVAASTYNAVIDYDGKKEMVQLFSGDTSEILASAGIKVGAEDLVVRSAQKTTSGEIEIIVKSAYEVSVASDQQIKTVTVHYGDIVGQALVKAGVTLNENDLVTPSVSERISADTSIQVERQFHVNIIADGKSTAAVVAQGSVVNALSQAGVTLGSEDTVSMDKVAAVSEGMKITVARVTYNEVASTEDIAYTKTSEKCSTLYKGNTQLQNAGKNGSQTIITRLKFLDGKAAGSTVIRKTVVEQPVNQVTLVGTKRRPSAYADVNADGTVTDQSGKAISFKRVISGKCSAYTGGGTTSTGRAAAFGLIAVDPKVIPYGSKLYICSPNGKTVYGYAIAADTGGFANNGRIIADLYYNTNGQCKNFGVRNMNIYVL